MSATDATQGKLIVNAQGAPVFLGELGREKNRPLVGKRNQAGIEGSIKVSGEQETVVDVEPLGISFASCPRLDVTGAQQAWLGHSGDGAAPTPIDQQRVTKHILPDAPDDQFLNFGRARKATRLRFEYP